MSSSKAPLTQHGSAKTKDTSNQWWRTSISSFEFTVLSGVSNSLGVSITAGRTDGTFVRSLSKSARTYVPCARIIIQIRTVCTCTHYHPGPLASNACTHLSSNHCMHLQSRKDTLVLGVLCSYIHCRYTAECEGISSQPTVM